MGVRATVRRLLDWFPAVLARLGLVERVKATEAFDLAVPVMVTGGLRVLLRMADFLFVGIALGDAAIAGLELGFQYYFIGFGLSLALTSGTISVVSRLQGAGERARANLAVKQSLWLSLAVSLPLGGQQFDGGLLREIVRVATPLTGMRLLQSTARFPFLFILGVLGTPAVAAYAIGRRVMLLALMPAWGYSTAASTLVGQSLGAGDEDGANEYGWQTLRLGLATQLLAAGVLVLAARPIATAFGTEHVALTVDFIRVFGLATAGFSASRTMRGSLRGAGDTRWPLYGTFLGSYVVRLPLAALTLPTAFTVSVAGLSLAPGMGLGYPAIFLAIIGDFYTKAAVNTGRFWTGRWKAVARRAGVGASD
ncbi:MATE family efflux transporter [Salinibaculum salinum]|uniref:MATE family efflux transporter n=1 Tax=Salinibaculum salinum TaxID=3131996 RepID=UPI0030EE45AE